MCGRNLAPLCGKIYAGNIHRHPKHTVAHFIGMLGSGFAIDLVDGYKKHPALGLALCLAEGLDRLAIKVLNSIGESEDQELLSNVHSQPSNRVTEALTPNFAYKYPEEPIEHHRLIDGGILRIGENRHNFASIATLVRGVDMRIMCDANDNPEQENPKHLGRKSRTIIS